MKNWIRRILLACVAMMIVVSCFACARDVLPATEKGSPYYDWGNYRDRTLTIWGRKTDFGRTYMTRAFRRYETMTGNRIVTKGFAAEELETALAAALNGNASDAPDLVLNYGGTNVDALDPDRNFVDFSDAPWVDDLTDTAINQTIYHGKVIGLPHWESSISGTLYNKKIFRRLGIVPPTTAEEFLSVCEQLKKKGVTPLYLPCATPSMLLYQFPLDTLVESPDVLKGLNDLTVGYDDLAGMETVVAWYRTMASRGYLGDDYLTNDWDGMSGALESGEYAMMLAWDTWLYTDFKGNPSDFGIMPAFIGLPEKGTFEGPNLALIMVNSNGAQKEAACDLVTFMADPYNYNVAFEGIYVAPVFKRQYAHLSTPQYVETAASIEQYYHDSVAWLRIRGFSQSDSSCIIRAMEDPSYTILQCLSDMESLRRRRLEDRA